MQLGILIIVCSLIFTGCNKVEYKDSDEINGRALVLSAEFTPSSIEQKISTIPIGTGMKIGPGLYLRNDYILEEYEVTLECEFGEIILEEEEFYDIVKDQVGDYVDITYCLKYRIVYDSKTNTVMSKELQNYVIKSIALISE